MRQLEAMGQIPTPVDVATHGWQTVDGCWAHVLGGIEKLDRRAVDSLPESVELVCFLGTGFHSQVDVAALKERDVVTCHTPYANARSTAEFALSLLLIGLRRTVVGISQIERCEWSPPLGRSLRECDIGVIGFGHVGRRLMEILVEGFGVTPLVWNRTPRDDAIRNAGGRPTDLETIFANCNAITLHIDQSPGDPPSIGADLLALAKPDLVLVNTARGQLIDPQALRTALIQNPGISVLADVYPQEPVCANTDPFGLLGLGTGQFLLTPHMAYSTHDAARNAGAMLLENIEAYLEGQPVPYPAAT